jgi:hypothetical protein
MAAPNGNPLEALGRLLGLDPPNALAPCDHGIEYACPCGKKVRAQLDISALIKTSRYRLRCPACKTILTIRLQLETSKPG